MYSLLYSPMYSLSLVLSLSYYIKQHFLTALLWWTVPADFSRSEVWLSPVLWGKHFHLRQRGQARRKRRSWDAGLFWELDQMFWFIVKLRRTILRPWQVARVHFIYRKQSFIVFFASLAGLFSALLFWTTQSKYTTSNERCENSRGRSSQKSCVWF